MSQVLWSLALTTWCPQVGLVGYQDVVSERDPETRLSQWNKCIVVNPVCHLKAIEIGVGNGGSNWCALCG